MAEPTVTEQIATALSAVYAKLAEWNSRYGGGLVSDLVTGYFRIKGGEDDEGNILPVLVENLEASGSIVANTVDVEGLSVVAISGDTTLTGYSGKTLVVTAAITLTPDFAAPANGVCKFCQIFNTSTGNVAVTCPASHTLNGAGITINIGAGKAALLIKISATEYRLFGGA